MAKSWAVMQQENKEEIASRQNLLIVDGLNLAFRFKGQVSQPFASSYLRIIQSLAQSYSAKQVLILSDKGRSKFRSEIFPGYKANRDEKYANKTPEEEEVDRKFFEYYKEALELCEKVSPTFVYKGVEADDLAGVAVSYLADSFDNIWLASTDGDWDTLLRHNVKRFSYKTRREYTIDNLYEEHGVDTVDQFISLKALQGDPGDGINGVDGVGIKRGYTIIRQFGSALDIVDQLPLPGKQVFIQNVNKSEELILRNLQLVDLPSFCHEAVRSVEGAYEDFTSYLEQIRSNNAKV